MTRRMYGIGALSMLGFAMWAASPAPAAVDSARTSGGTLVGTVFTRDGDAVSHATIDVVSLDTRSLRMRSQADQSGSFRVSSLPVGKYMAIATRGGYRGTTEFSVDYVGAVVRIRIELVTP